jgi:putative molybdopterin biosynthesis protein
VQAASTHGATETSPRELALADCLIVPGTVPDVIVGPGLAAAIATGGMLPRGADAVVMVEHTEVARRGAETGGTLHVTRAVSAGEHVTFAGTDVSKGETVLRSGTLVTAREVGVLAALGRPEALVYRPPRVAVLSTGDEIVEPGKPLPAGCVYDANAHLIAAALQELGAEPVMLGIVPDDALALDRCLRAALRHDMVILSGGTSKGAGDLSYRVVSGLRNPGIVAHGVALKPGKPICLAVTEGKPVVVLPGFPTSAIFTFHEFVAPVIRAWGGRAAQPRTQMRARLPSRVNSERGRTEYLLVSLVAEALPASSGARTEALWFAYPMGKGSGSVTTYCGADGFVTIPQQTELLEAGSTVEVSLLGASLAPADLVVIGSHCVGLDALLSELHHRGVRAKALAVGSTAGLAAARAGQCDVAGVHLLDPATGEYNRPFLTAELDLVRGYRRMQGVVFRKGDVRFERKTPRAAVAAALADDNCLMVNRNSGSGTRMLIEQLLAQVWPEAGGSAAQAEEAAARGNIPGYAVQAKSHHAVAAAILQGRADWGVAIETVARQYDLGFLPVAEEQYDFVIPKSRRERKAVLAFVALLDDPVMRERLAAMHLRCGG